MARRLRGSLRAGACIVPLIACLAVPLTAQTTSPVIENRADAAWLDANGNGGTAQGISTVLIGGRPGSIVLTKSVNRTFATPGDTLTYTLRWSNPGSAAAESVTITDSLPDALTFISAVTSAGVTHTVAVARVILSTDSVAPGARDSAQILVTVGRIGEVSNVAVAEWASTGGTQRAETDAAATTVEAREMRIELEALVDRPLQVGDTLPFRIRLINPSAGTPIQNVVVTDSLPAELEFLYANPSAALSGGMLRRPSTLGGAAAASPTWSFDVLEAGDTLNIDLYTQVRAVGNGVLTNRAAAIGNGLTEAVAAAASVVTRAEGLVVQRTATALEIGTGEAVGYSITVGNTGPTPLDDVVLRDVTSAGFRLQPATVRGATLASSDNRTLHFELGTLAAGASVTVSFVATLDGPRGTVVENRASASAGGAFQSDTVSLAVRLRGPALSTRLVMGRVWLDENGDGRQQPDERPLANAVVWVSSGYTVRADTLGRFTAQDLASGLHALRVDPLSMPDGWLNSDPVSVRVDGFTSPVVSFAIRRDPARAVATAGDSIEAGFLLDALNVPRPRFAAPAAGAVIGTNRLFLRVEGEPSAAVRLLDNDREIGSAVLRADGSFDFIGVEVKPGAHRFNAVIDGTAGEQRISVDVHVSGAVARVERYDTTALRAGTTQRIALRITDEWNIPVAQRPLVTVAGRNLRIAEPDADPSSVGHQLPAGDNGVLLVPVVADSAGAATLVASYGSARTVLTLDFMPQIRSLVVVGSGELGVGATRDAAGSLVARGAFDERASITVSLDTRRGRDDAFGGAIDPLAEAQQPVIGDASEHAAVGSTTLPLSVRVEQDRNWLLLGDVDTRGFGDERSPGAYNRALPGMSGQWSDGLLDLTGFGAIVSQQLVQRQIPGNGTSGPFHLGGAIQLGTERLAIETRDRLNASLVLSRRELERFVDYDIDATTGTVLLRQALMSQDVAGNPLVLVALAEQLNGRESLVAGGRAALTMTPFGSEADSVGMALGYIEDESTLGAHRILSGWTGANMSWGAASLEFAHAAHPDSAGTAYRANVRMGEEEGTGLEIEWNYAGDRFFNPANPSLVGGTGDVRIGSSMQVTDDLNATASYVRQWFRSSGAKRDRASMGVVRELGGRTLSLDLGVQQEQIDRDSADARMSSATSRIALKDGNDAVWLEALQPLNTAGAAKRPATYGIGASYQVMKALTVQAAHRLIRSDSSTDGVTTLGVRTDLGTGTRIWSEYQLLENVTGRTSAALIGIGQKVRLTSEWSIDAQYERRSDLSGLPETDLERALPLARTQEAYWAAAAGTEWTPSSAVRTSLRAELSDGTERGRGYRVLGSAEAALSPSWTLFARQDSRESHRKTTDGTIRSGESRSVLAAAFRPAASSEWNSLFKLEYRSDENPMRDGGALLSGTDRRVIGALETVWTPIVGTELGARVALRRSALGGAIVGGADVIANTQFYGVRARRDISDRFDVRVNARGIAETRSGMFEWDLAPAVGVALIEGVELEAGYRFGELRDADFAQNASRGVYLTLGMSFTEQTGRAIADFWRSRLDGGR